MLAEERDWFDMAANPFVLGESADPHAFLLSCGVAYYTDAPAERGGGWTTTSAGLEVKQECNFCDRRI